MNVTSKILSLLSMALFITACGTDGSTPDPLPNLSLNYDFRVISTSPQNGSANVNSSTNTAQIFFSEDVDPATINATNILVKKQVNGSTVNITPTFPTINGTMVDVQLEPGNLSENTIYYVIFLPGITSNNNNTLYDGDYPQGVQISFNTGVGYGNSVSGPPSVISVEKYANFNGCFSAMIRFNEDVSLYFNDITINSTAIFGTGGGTVDTTIYPFYQNRQDVWVAEANCSLLGVWDFLQEITVTVHDAIDLEGNHLPSPYSRTF
ncbi:MAG: Ig-like domain-containing protein [Bdellovibrionales bacterium]|nr:Ig-like domain-containing protein [Bdellovibrionales bacterium]